MRKKKSFRRILPVIIALLFSVCLSENKAYADSYTYSVYGNVIPAPDAYQWEKSIRAKDLGIDSISNISEVFCRNGKIYIAMDGKIVVTDEDFKTLQIISEYERDGKKTSVSAPKGVFASADGDIYITEEEMGEIIQFDAQGRFKRALGDPKITGLENVKYAPTKVAVDDAGRIFVKAKSVYEGIIELDPDGNFNRYVGANKVSPSILQLFYRAIATKEQVSRMELFLPTDYSDIALDKDGFLMAAVRDNTSKNPIRKINSNGKDIMTEYEFIDPPMGDIKNGHTISTLTTISTSDDGRFGVLDANMCRIFVYSEDGILAYTMGGNGKREGQLSSPADIAFCGDRILEADLVTCSIEVFKPTGYGEAINKALRYQGMYDYKTAAQYWKQAYEYNPNSVLVNMGLGKYQLRANDYQGVMKSFKATGERVYYSSAFEMVREAFLEHYLGWILVGVITLIAAIKIFSIVIKRLGKRGVFEDKKFFMLFKKFRKNFFTWPGYILSHPFKAFDDIKYENAGSTASCAAILLLFSWATLIRWRYAGFLVNYHDVEHPNVSLILISSICPYIIFVVANWAVGVLIDGKGSLINIFKVNMYALYPSVYMLLIGTLLSKIVIYEETPLVRFFFYFPFVIYVFYTFAGLVTIHQYSFTKGIISVLLSLVAMFILIFIILLLFSLVSGFVNDTGTIMDEIKLYL